MNFNYFIYAWKYYPSPKFLTQVEDKYQEEISIERTSLFNSLSSQNSENYQEYLQQGQQTFSQQQKHFDDQEMSRIHERNKNSNKFITRNKYSQASDLQYKQLLDDLNQGYSDQIKYEGQFQNQFNDSNFNLNNKSHQIILMNKPQNVNYQIQIKKIQFFQSQEEKLLIKKNRLNILKYIFNNRKEQYLYEAFKNIKKLYKISKKVGQICIKCGQYFQYSLIKKKTCQKDHCQRNLLLKRKQLYKQSQNKITIKTK